MAGSRVLKASLAAAVVTSLGFTALLPAAGASQTVKRAKLADKARNAQKLRGIGVSRRPRPGLLLPLGPGGRFPASVLANLVDSSLLQRPLSRECPPGQSIRSISRMGLVRCQTAGDITSVSAGGGLTGGGASGAVELAIAPPLVFSLGAERAAPGPDEHRHRRGTRGGVELQLRHRLLPRAGSQRRSRAAGRHLRRIQGRRAHRLQLRNRRLRAPGGAPERGQPQAGHLCPHRGRRPRDRRGDERRHRRRRRPLRPLHEHGLRLIRGVLLGQCACDGNRQQVEPAASASTTRSTPPTATSSTPSWSRPT